MRFNDLSITNFRGIRHFAISDLRDTIVLAGPNGCGKSCVLDGIRLLKSLYGGYQPGEIQQWFTEFQTNVRNPQDVRKLLRNPESDLVVQSTIELAQEELDFLRNNSTELLTPLTWRRLLSQDLDFDTMSIVYSQVMQQRRDEFYNALIQNTKVLTDELKSRTHMAGVTITPAGELRAETSLVLNTVFQTYDPAHLGVIDYHSSARSYEREALGGVNLNLDATRTQRRNYSLYNWRDKYKNVKSELAAHYVRGMIASEAGADSTEENVNETLKLLFQTFFPDKSYDGPIAQLDGSVIFPVRLSEGSTHDIDDLSSGEKELLYGYLRLRSSSPRRSIILLDEPELHLNPRLLQGMPDFYHKHLGQALKSQLWLVTHSDAILRQAVGNPNFSVFHMSAATIHTPDNQALPVVEDDDLEEAIVEIVGDLAAYKPRAKVVLLEGGGDNEVDVHIVSRLFPDFAQKVNLVPGGSKRRVRDLYEVLDTVAAHAGLSERFFAITDRDREFKVLDDAHMFRWDRYHIENYLLDLHFVHDATCALVDPKDRPATEAVTDERMRNAAQSLVNQLVLERLQEMVNGEMTNAIAVKADPTTVDPSGDLLPSIQGTLGRLQDIGARLIKDTWLEDRAKEIRDEMLTSLQSGSWREVFPGRSILARYVSENVPGVAYRAFRNAILDKMSTAGHKPTGMATVLTLIEP